MKERLIYLAVWVAIVLSVAAFWVVVALVTALLIGCGLLIGC